MMESSQNRSCSLGCQAPVPQELQEQHLCVLHFIQRAEQICTDMRKETALQKADPSRRGEIAHYLKATSMKLSEVAVGHPALSDTLKRRVLSTFLMLMNLRDSLDRSAIRRTTELAAPKPSLATVPGPSRSNLLRKIRA